MKRFAAPYQGFRYDAVGNRHPNPGTDWIYSSRNELLSSGSGTLWYDLNGNLTQKTEGSNTWIYAWDAENRLLSVKRNGATKNSYTYDALGRRRTKAIGGATIATVTYQYAGADIYRDREGWGPSETETYRLYTNGPGIDEPLEVETTGANPKPEKYFFSDALGSVLGYATTVPPDPYNPPPPCEECDPYVYELRQYDAYGNVSTDGFGNLETGTQGTARAFTGREWDAEAGLYYYRARYYDPKLGRFISEDPIGFAGGLNFYSYANNNPTNFIDPDGQAPRATGKKSRMVRTIANLIDLWQGAMGDGLGGIDEDTLTDEAIDEMKRLRHERALHPTAGPAAANARRASQARGARVCRLARGGARKLPLLFWGALIYEATTTSPAEAATNEIIGQYTETVGPYAAAARGGKWLLER